MGSRRLVASLRAEGSRVSSTLITDDVGNDQDDKPEGQEYRVIVSGKTRKYNWDPEQLAGVLLVLMDTQGMEIGKVYKIYKGKSRHVLTFGQIRDILETYVLSWYPETFEKELIFEQREQSLKFRAVYRLMDRIEVEFDWTDSFCEGLSWGMTLAEVTEGDESVLEMDGAYVPVMKRLLDQKRRNRMKRFTTVFTHQRAKTVIAPFSHKEAIQRKIRKSAAERLRDNLRRTNVPRVIRVERRFHPDK
jgi:hypothetical protein